MNAVSLSLLGLSFIFSVTFSFIVYKRGIRNLQISEEYLEKNRFIIKNEKQLAILEKKKELILLEEYTMNKIKKLENEINKNQLDFENYVIQTKKNLEEKLYSLSSLSKQEAKKIIFDKIKLEIKSDIERFTHLELIESKKKIKKITKDYLISLMERYSGSVSFEKNFTAVPLVEDNIKGKIIGKEGRNIRSFELITGVELIIDNTPNVVFLSSFDPVKRKIAENLLIDLIENSRLNPSYIETEYKTKVEEFDKSLPEKGLNILIGLKLPSFGNEINKLIAKLKYRTSYGQNLLKHSIEVSNFAGILASELGEDVMLAKQAGLLHDIGKVMNTDSGETHVNLGVSLAKKHNLSKIIINAIESHHADIAKEHIISEFVSIADSLSAARLGARKELYELYIKKLKNLEDIANTFEEVNKCHVFQSGREIRVIVHPNKIKDEELNNLAYKIKKRIETENNNSGLIKVTAIRETRGISFAK